MVNNKIVKCKMEAKILKGIIQQLTQTPQRGSSYQPRATPWGGIESKPAPYRGKSFCTFSASSLKRPSPRASPWAMSGLALQAAL